MANVFDTAMKSLFSDPNITTDAIFMPQIGQSKTLKVVTHAPDILQNMGSSVIETPTLVLEVQIADCPVISQGDVFSINGNNYTVQGQPLRDAQQLLWQVDLYAS